MSHYKEVAMHITYLPLPDACTTQESLCDLLKRLGETRTRALPDGCLAIIIVHPTGWRTVILKP